MKVSLRVTNSLVMTAAVVAVIIGSLCFSVGEGLRLTPFPNSSVSPVHDRNLIAAAAINEVPVAKHAPLDVPAQTQKRGKRLVVEPATVSFVRTRPVFTAVIRSAPYQADDADFDLFVAAHSGRAPPRHS